MFIPRFASPRRSHTPSTTSSSVAASGPRPIFSGTVPPLVGPPASLCPGPGRPAPARLPSSLGSGRAHFLEGDDGRAGRLPDRVDGDRDLPARHHARLCIFTSPAGVARGAVAALGLPRRPAREGEHPVFKRIVVGTDGSETAQEAVRQAADLAKSTGAALDIVSAYGGDNVDGSTRLQKVDRPADVPESAREQVNFALDSATGIA